MTHDQSAQHCRSGHTPCTGLFLSPVHHARHKVCRLLLFTSTHTENEVLSLENPNTTPSAAQQPENNGSERMFSQSEVNTIVADRLARERSKSAERVGDLDAREKDLKAREEALEAKSQRFSQWEAREACKQYLADNHISAALLDKLDTSDPEAFKTAVKAVQSVTGNGYTVTTTTTGAKVDTPPTWLSQGKDKDAELKRAFGLSN